MAAEFLIAGALTMSQALSGLEGCWTGAGKLSMSEAGAPPSSAGMPFGNAPCFFSDGDQLNVYGGASLFNQTSKYEDVWTITDGGVRSKALVSPHNPVGAVQVQSFAASDEQHWAIDAIAVTTRDKGEANGLVRIERAGDQLLLTFDVTINGYEGPVQWRATASHLRQ